MMAANPVDHDLVQSGQWIKNVQKVMLSLCTPILSLQGESEFEMLHCTADCQVFDKPQQYIVLKYTSIFRKFMELFATP